MRKPLPSREADFSRPAAVITVNDEIRNLAAAGVTRVDLAGSTVAPGFIDAHLHTASSGLRHLKDVGAAALVDRSRRRPGGAAR